MSITRIDNLLSKEEIDHIDSIRLSQEPYLHEELGRIQFNEIKESLSPETIEKLTKIARYISDLPLLMSNAMIVEYNSLYGSPNLRTHVDRDTNELIINMQLESNTVWPIGLNLETYTLDDNSALIFNANKETHWRVHKEFKEGEYVRMVFIRFYNPEKISDYSHISDHPDDEIFKEAREFRDSLGVF
jgi:hypothetical protein